MERTKQRPEEPREPRVPLDYFIVATGLMEWLVSREMAAFIDECLDQTPAPRWITFVDLTGARVRLRARLLQHVSQCTVDQRALSRAMQRAMNEEFKSDRDWDDDR